MLLGAALLMVSHGEAALRYARATAESLHEPTRYIEAVLRARPLSHPAEVAR